MVKIYGHYALIEEAKITFHRHLIRSFDFTECDGKNRWTAYKFVRKVYDHFAPIHLKRIQSAVARLCEPNLESFTSAASAESESTQADSQETATSAPSSQNAAGFKKPRLPPKVMLQLRIDRLEEEHDQERQQAKQRIDRLEEQNKEFMDLLKQQAQSNASAGNGSDGQRELKQENERLIERLNQERQEAKQEMNGLKEQIKGLMDMLKQRLS